MATKKRSTIKSRKEKISARKPKTLSSILKGQTKLSRSFKESVGIAATVAGPGKILKAGKLPKHIKDLMKKAAKAEKSGKLKAFGKGSKIKKSAKITDRTPKGFGPTK